MDPTEPVSDKTVSEAPAGGAVTPVTPPAAVPPGGDDGDTTQVVTPDPGRTGRAPRVRANKGGKASDVEVGPDQPPAVTGVADWFRSFGLSDIDPILALFDGVSRPNEVWDAIEAVAALGRKAEAFLESPGPLVGTSTSPTVRGAVGASAVGAQELCAQLEQHCRPKAGAAGAEVVNGKVQMDPVLASLLITLATKVVQTLLDRLRARV